jgi:hypothetical protein
MALVERDRDACAVRIKTCEEISNRFTSAAARARAMSLESIQNGLCDLHRTDHLDIEKLGPYDDEIFVLGDVVLDQRPERRFAAADVAGDTNEALIADGVDDAIDDMLQTGRDENFIFGLRRVGEWIDRFAFATLFRSLE